MEITATSCVDDYAACCNAPPPIGWYRGTGGWIQIVGDLAKLARRNQCHGCAQYQEQHAGSQRETSAGRPIRAVCAAICRKQAKALNDETKIP